MAIGGEATGETAAACEETIGAILAAGEPMMRTAEGRETGESERGRDTIKSAAGT